MGNGQQMKHRIGRATHGNIQRHGVEKGFAGSNALRQYTFIAFFIIFIGILHDKCCCILEKSGTIGMSGENRSISRQGHTDSFIQTVHRVGSEHSRATSASWTSMVFNLCHVFIAHTFVGTLYHRIYQVQMLSVPFTGFHRTTANKHGRDIQPHRRHQHSRSNLVTITDAHHGIGLVGIYHVFHRIGNDVTTRQGIKHPIMSHRNTVIHSNRIELGSKTTKLLYFRFHQLPDFVQMRMSGHKLSKRVDDGYDRLANHLTLHAIGHPKGTCSCHAATLCAECTS